MPSAELITPTEQRVILRGQRFGKDADFAAPRTFLADHFGVGAERFSAAVANLCLVRPWRALDSHF